MARLSKHGTELARFTRGQSVYSFRSDGALMRRVVGQWKLFRRKCDYAYFRTVAAALHHNGYKETLGETVSESFIPTPSAPSVSNSGEKHERS